MWHHPKEYDVIVIGAGHAGCEAALAAARRGASVLLLTMNLDSIAKMSCNPAVGGIGKGHMVREIDALGGEMGKVTDRTAIQKRMLNRSRGPAVWAPRAQTDKWAYSQEMKKRLEQAKGLDLFQSTAEEISKESNSRFCIKTKEGLSFLSKTVVISSGTFMRGEMFIGKETFSGGRAGDLSSNTLSSSLKKLGFNLKRLKTGTPPRVNGRSIDFDKMEKQEGEIDLFFSYDKEESKEEMLPQLPCWITYTTKETQEIILANLSRSPLYSGMIHGIGPRYCPSIEDKIKRFSDKERHQIFLEPEGIHTSEYYVGGASTSLPFDVQMDIIHSIIGLDKAEIIRPAYAIEYDALSSGQITTTLESKAMFGLFFAGQLNGTTGYEEAAAQGLIAGINAASRALGLPSFTLTRAEAYIGVMIDDLVTKTIEEPYRMFTSRAEHRLLLRQDNADLRLREYGYQLGLIDNQHYERLLHKKKCIEKGLSQLSRIYKQEDGRGISLSQLLARPEMSYHELLALYPGEIEDFGASINEQIELALKYAGYIEREVRDVKRFNEIERIHLPSSLDFNQVIGLKIEAKEKLSLFRPENLGQASRINGVTPADIQMLLVHLKRRSSR